MVAGVYAIILLLCTYIGESKAFQMYADRIPNGHNVKHPCNPNINWYGVGHNNPQGGGTRNPFGISFEENNHVNSEPFILNKDI